MDGFVTTPHETAPAEIAAPFRAPDRPARRRGGGLALRAASFAGFFALWWLAAWHAADPRLLPDPATVARVAWRETLHGALIANFAITIARVLAAFAVSMLVGVALGVLAGRRAAADALIDPVLTILLNLPLLVVILVCFIWIGQSEAGLVVAVALAKIPTVAVTVREGARALDTSLADVAAVFAVPRWRRLRCFVLPQLAPYIAAAGRSGLSITWKIVLVAEVFGPSSGIGYALNLAFQNWDVAAVMAYGLLFSGLMLAVEALALRPAERAARAWRCS
jgi:NitT/TauT family transport system permease protein